ncbi:type IV toxin-antitoxin system AbiEi family antitoxin domain-containing protein [Micromonospora citrea]|uniref:type IV toxin-antitoxin system AbiEi family antitoxin domain-containing protein n=1 Tax=Micromonospora citrea TaxID=47855 RepID=UPI003C44740F
MDALTVLRRMAAQRDGVVTLRQARAAGLTVHEVQRLCRAGRWRVVARGGYLVDADLHDGIPRRARIRAVVASFGPSAAAVLGTAAELHGIAGCRRTDEIHLSVPGKVARPLRAAHPEVVVHQLVVAPGELVRVAGIATTGSLRTVADVILREARYPAVCVIDSALNRGLVTDEELLTRPRLIRGGYLLGIGDLGWRVPRLIAEADGRGPHGTSEAVFADRRRQNRLLNAGWRILRFTWQDTLDPHYIPWTVRQAIAAAQAPRS